MEQRDLRGVVDAFSRVGVSRLYAKRLTENDNSKNQVYLGGSFALLNRLPFAHLKVVESSRGRAVIHAPIVFYWMADNGVLIPAPHAKLILYPQYPEVRLSGFLRGASNAPSGLMGVSARVKGRVLLLGVRTDHTVVARVLSPHSSSAQALISAGAFDGDELLAEIPLQPGDPRAQLLARLAAIAQEGWIDSCRLDSDGNVVPCDARNCGGMTLEARLGIRPNAVAGPDLLGWEVKQFAVRDFTRCAAKSAITLFTPEPTEGFYASDGAEAFVRKYGYPDMAGQPNRINFGGRFLAGDLHQLTGLTLHLQGYDPIDQCISDPLGGLALIDGMGGVAAAWPYTSLIEHWNRKHEQAAYVPSMTCAGPRRYRFAERVFLGIGTDFGRFLRAVNEKKVFYDPGIKVEDADTAAPRTHRRSQFRISFRQLGHLYAEFAPTDAVPHDA